MTTRKEKKVCLVVLGDIGRSPRMQYHGLSLAQEGFQVTFVGYCQSAPIKYLRSSENVKFQNIYQCPEFKQYLPTFLAYTLKVIWQIITIFLALIKSGISDYIIIQNPPALPALGVCYIYSALCRNKLIIDWHNYAYSILALSLGAEHILVKLSRQFEFFFGKKADYNLCVTKGMKHDLQDNHNIKAITFYDRPPDIFKRTNIEEQHKLFLALGLEYDIFLRNCKRGETAFTKVMENLEVVLRNDRPGLLISSTSWTEDEDFSILLSALEEYEKAKQTSVGLPELVCAITGKGPLKEFYINIIKRRKWKYVHVVTPWLEAEDYPKFLGSADLGVCLHKSSSGLDLPMKVVDMFGCGVPVCAISFNCLPELVKHQQNGYVFKDDKELFTHIKNWFTGFPLENSPVKKTFQESLKQFQIHRWHDNWKFNVQPLLE
ncbi:hypothetical protein RUM44_003037 [Polyplax serrata]|uniref:Beta-1,4-mannosyltransferase n=1 Tax=Polyplax serrata TaxID=468196 RepID=A0ABR1AXI3_POLSC